MKFKIDENLPIEAAALLREAGHDALIVHDQNLRGALAVSMQ
jgi:predicted nuclease of predicted toxin-antitoxin system